MKRQFDHSPKLGKHGNLQETIKPNELLSNDLYLLCSVGLGAFPAPDFEAVETVQTECEHR